MRREALVMNILNLRNVKTHKRPVHRALTANQREARQLMIDRNGLYLRNLFLISAQHHQDPLETSKGKHFGSHLAESFRQYRIFRRRIHLDSLFSEHLVEVNLCDFCILDSFSSHDTLDAQIERINRFLCDEGQRPRKEVQVAWQAVGSLRLSKLFDIEFSIEHEHSTFVLVGALVVRRTEDCHNGRKGVRSTPSVHLVSINLDFVSPEDRKVVIARQELF